MNSNWNFNVVIQICYILFKNTNHLEMELLQHAMLKDALYMIAPLCEVIDAAR